MKNVIRKNQILADTYRKLIFFKDFFPRDVLNFEKFILFKKVYSYTMVGYKRLSNIYDLSKLMEKEKKAGAFVECGVWKGGCSAVMAFIAHKANSNRKIWLFDSFEGLPEPTEKDGSLAKTYAANKNSGKLTTINECVGPLEDVEKIFFSKLKINKNNIKIKKGWFQNTLPKAKKEIGSIAILRLDGDWYESTKCCLDNLYDDVIHGGYIVIDDYGYWEGARRALDEFFLERKINPDLVRIDEAGIYFKKNMPIGWIQINKKNMEKSKNFIIPGKFLKTGSLFKRIIKSNKKLHESLWKLKHFFVISYYKFNKKADSIFKYVEIETYPICNRKCSFCPISQDKTPKKMMSDELFNKIINELKELHFKGDVSLSSYGEPLLDKRLTRFTKKIKAELGSKIIINTNGDFLTIEKFRELVSAGVDTIAVSQHDKEPSSAIKNLFSEVSLIEQRHLAFSVINEDSLLVNRGGSVEVKASRTLFACPIRNIYIRADGNVRFCCNDYYCEVKVGNVNQSKLIDIWNNPFYKKIRNEIRRDIFNLKICKKCLGIISSKE